MKSNHYIETLLRKFANNECSPEEIEQVFDYLRSSQADSALHALIDEEIWQTINATSQEKINEQLAAEMFKTIEQSVRKKKPVINKKIGSSFFSYPFWKYAAVLAGILLTAVLAFYMLDNNKSKHVAFSTAYGQTATYILPDSSLVTLNGNSSIHFAPNWSKNKPREVWLKGEAFFSVKHTPDHQKFKVNTSDNFQVEVLGTEFSVYNRKAKTRVVLNSGKVALKIQQEEKQDQIMMNPGELVEFKSDSKKYLKKGVNAEMYSSWINKKLILDNTSFREIAMLIEDTYGLSVVVPNKSFYEERFSGIVPCENADMLLKALSLSFNLKYQQNEHQVKFLNE